MNSWNNFRQVRFWNNLHQVPFWNNLHHSAVTNREKTLIFEFNVPEYHTAEIFPDERIYIKVPF